MYNKIRGIINSLVKNEVLHLDAPIIINSTTPSPTLYIWALCAPSLGDVYVSNEEGQWHQVENTDNELLNSIYQHLRVVQSRYAAILVVSTKPSNTLVA